MTERVAYGLAVTGTDELRGLLEPYPGVERSLTVVAAQDADALRAGFPSAHARRVSEAFDEQDRLAFAIDEHPAAGWLIWAADYGTFVLDRDGRTVRSAGAVGAAWGAFILSQVMPFAALVQGLEIFHAAAVIWDGRVVVIAGDPGAGKTSVVAHALLAGATFVADDVLAVEDREGSLVAHPGPAELPLRDEELRLLGPADRERLGVALGKDERGRPCFRPAAANGLAPVGAMVFLGRGGETAALSIRDTPIDPRLILASSFNFVLQTPERLARQLDVCWRLSRQARMVEVDAPAHATAAEVAAALRAHLVESGA